MTSTSASSFESVQELFTVMASASSNDESRGSFFDLDNELFFCGVLKGDLMLKENRMVLFEIGDLSSRFLGSITLEDGSVFTSICSVLDDVQF